MSVRRKHEARDCETGSTDWTSIGTRILQAAAVASGVHLIEQVRASGRKPESESVGNEHEPTDRLSKKRSHDGIG